MAETGMPAALLIVLALGAGVAIGLALARRGKTLLSPPARPPVRLPAPDTEHQSRLAEAGKQLAMVAHEIRNPLGAILAFAEDLLQGDPTAEQREALEVIQQQARRSRMIVRGLLDSVRAAPPAQERLDPRALSARVAQVFERECAARGLRLETSIAGALPLLTGDEAGLEQVLTNLLQNACQATPSRGTVSLSVRLRGRLLEFTVRDTGAGIPADALPHLFDPFYTTKGKDEGTGLGLSVAQGIVRSHRGTLVAENVPVEEGGGARFVMALPFEDRRAADRDVIPATGEDAPAAGWRILLIDDDEAVRGGMRRLLTRRGWIVDDTADASSGLWKLLGTGPESRFDGVVCDLGLAGMSGIEFHDRVAAEVPGMLRRLVMVTGDSGGPGVQAFRARTGAVVLEKPFEIAALEAALRRVITGTPA